MFSHICGAIDTRGSIFYDLNNLSDYNWRPNDRQKFVDPAPPKTLVYEPVKMNLSEAQNAKEWIRRLFTLRPMLLLLVISSIFLTELRFDWAERVLNAYLTTTNSFRPESGAIWEKGHRTMTARQTLEQIVTDRLSTQREALNAQNFPEIAKTIGDGKRVMVSDEDFRRLYHNLPLAVAQDIVSPYELLQLVSDGRWMRTYFEKTPDGLSAYLLDSTNRVLRQFDLSKTMLERLEQGETLSAQSLDELPNYENRIYPADRFFDVLETFPEDLRRAMVPQPEVLLNTPGRIARVGISDEAVSGFIELGFEIVDGNRHWVIPVQGNELAVWQLRSRLEGKPHGPSPVEQYLEDRAPL
jgi:hypothetical protein